jgi:hypothetical protein
MRYGTDTLSQLIVEIYRHPGNNLYDNGYSITEPIFLVKLTYMPSQDFKQTPRAIFGIY